MHGLTFSSGNKIVLETSHVASALAFLYIQPSHVVSKPRGWAHNSPKHVSWLASEPAQPLDLLSATLITWNEDLWEGDIWTTGIDRTWGDEWVWESSYWISAWGLGLCLRWVDGLISRVSPKRHGKHCSKVFFGGIDEFEVHGAILHRDLQAGSRERTAQDSHANSSCSLTLLVVLANYSVPIIAENKRVHQGLNVHASGAVNDIDSSVTNCVVSYPRRASDKTITPIWRKGTFPTTQVSLRSYRWGELGK